MAIGVLGLCGRRRLIRRACRVSRRAEDPLRFAARRGQPSTLGGNTAGTFVGPPFDGVGHAFSGEHAAVLGAIGTFGTLSQTFATVPGTEYQLTFWGSNGGAPPNEVTITLNRMTAFAAVDDPVHDYVLHVFDFIANRTTYTLLFDYEHGVSGAFVIDDVGVTSVPEPSTLILIVLGGGVLAACKWSKRR